jgi:hypothetical protein
MDYWRFEICAFSITPLLHHSNDARQLPVPSLAIMLGGAFRRAFFIPCKKLDLLKPLIPL